MTSLSDFLYTRDLLCLRSWYDDTYVSLDGWYDSTDAKVLYTMHEKERLELTANCWLKEN